MKISRRAVFTLLAAFVLMAALDVSAGNPIRKFARGIANVGFSPLEILIQPYDVAKEEGNISALTYGVLKGVAYTVARVGVGVTDIVTFPTPLPGCTDDPRDSGWGYGPMLRPEWVVDPEHNAYNFFYNNGDLMN